MDFLLLLFLLAMICMGALCTLSSNTQGSTHAIRSTKPRSVPRPARDFEVTGTAEIQPVETKKELDPAVVEKYNDILCAIGFSKREAKTKVNQILKQDPEITQEDFLRKATQK